MDAPLYAVNVADATKDASFIRMLISPVVPDRLIYWCEGRQDASGMGVGLQCDAGCAEAIVGIIRQQWAKAALRCYHRKTNKALTWQRL